MSTANLLKPIVFLNLVSFISCLSFSEQFFNLFSSSLSSTQPRTQTPFTPPTNSSQDAETREYLTQWASTYSFNMDELHDPSSASARYLSITAMPPCQFSKLNKYFDLTPMNLGNGPYFAGQETARQYKYFMNVCGGIGSSSLDCNQKAGAICQYLGTGAFNSVVGRWTDTTIAPTVSLISPTNPDGGIVIKYLNGDQCLNGNKGVTRQAVVNIPCVKNGKQQMIMSVDFDTPADCLFTINLPSPYSCSSDSAPVSSEESSGLSGGSIFLIIFFTVGFAYVAFGCLYMCQARGLRGMEACPNREMWVNCWDYEKAGCSFAWNKVRGLCGGGKDYSEL